MIICPLCSSQVLASKDGYPIKDGEDWDFYCPTSVTISQDFTWRHYTRTSYEVQFVGGPIYKLEHRAVIPPFEIRWFPEKNIAEVKQIIIKNVSSGSGYLVAYADILEADNVDLQGFLDTYERFKNLKAFS